MAQDTDYKKMWRSTKDENVKLFNLLGQANDRINALTDIIEKIKKGEIKIDEIQKIQGDMLIRKIFPHYKPPEIVQE